MRMVFVHGWGFDGHFWDALRARLPDREIDIVDFGFSCEIPQTPAVAGREKAVYITHSLGTMWALKYRKDNMRALVAINGFAYFGDFTSPRILQRMRKNLTHDAHGQMSDFWALCGAQPKVEHLDIARLDEGLSWLAQWDERQALVELKAPVVALAGDQDKVTPLAPMSRQWQGHALHICEDGGHALPITHSAWCAKTIEDFMDGF